MLNLLRRDIENKAWPAMSISVELKYEGYVGAGTWSNELPERLLILKSALGRVFRQCICRLSEGLYVVSDESGEEILIQE